MLSRGRAPSVLKRPLLGLNPDLWTTFYRTFALKRPLRLSWPHLSWSTPFQGESLIPELPIPPAPPTISIRECQEAIEIAGVIPITLRGEQMRITEIATRDISRWVSGDIRFTPKEPKEKELLTKRTREIIVDKDKSSPIALPRRKDRPRRHPASRGPICATPPKFSRSILSDCRCEVYPQATAIRGNFQQVVRSGCSCGQTDPETEPRNKTAVGVSFFTLLLTLSVIQKYPQK